MKITTIPEREVLAKPLSDTSDTSFTFTKPESAHIEVDGYRPINNQVISDTVNDTSKATKFNWRGLEVPKDRSYQETFPILIIVQNFNDVKQKIDLYIIDKQNKKSKTYIGTVKFK